MKAIVANNKYVWLEQLKLSTEEGKLIMQVSIADARNIYKLVIEEGFKYFKIVFDPNEEEKMIECKIIEVDDFKKTTILSLQTLTWSNYSAKMDTGLAAIEFSTAQEK